MPLIYLASPFSHPDPAVQHRRYLAVCEAAGAMVRDGLMVFCPIAHGYSVASVCELPTDWNYWKEWDRLMISKCDELHVLMLEGWQESVGVRAEIQIADELGIPVILRGVLAPDCGSGRFLDAICRDR